MNGTSTGRTGVTTWAIALLAITAACAVWLNLSGSSYRDFSPAILLIAYAPALLAILVAGMRDGGAGIRALARQLLVWRTGVHWYAIALLGPVALVCAATALSVALGGPVPAQWLVLPTAAGFVALLGPLILGSLGEELGWRGFAQPRLQRRWGALPAAIVVGLIWSAWHLWPVLTPLGASETSAADVVQALVRLVATSVIYAWLYLRTKGALPVVVIAHAAHNLAIELMPTEVLGTALGSLSVAALYAAVAIGLVAVDRTPWRTRARSTVESPTVDSRS